MTSSGSAGEFRKFPDEVEKNVPADLDGHVVMDKYDPHKTGLIRGGCVKRPRRHAHRMPISGSWINQVERFFAPLTERIGIGRKGQGAAVRRPVTWSAVFPSVSA